MSAPRIKIDTSQAQGLFAQLIAALDLTKGSGKKIAQELRDDAKRQFQAGGIPRWAPLSPATIEEKRRLGYPRLNRKGLVPAALMQRGAFGPENILIRTGALISSWTDASDPHNVENITETMVESGTDIPYAATHQEGGTGWRGAPIPIRPIVVTDRATARITEILEDAAAQ